MRISDWSSDVCSSDLAFAHQAMIVAVEHEDAARPGDADPVKPRHDGPQPAAAVGFLAEDIAKAAHDREIARSEEHTSELQSLMRISYAVFFLKKQQINPRTHMTPPSTKQD